MEFSAHPGSNTHPLPYITFNRTTVSPGYGQDGRDGKLCSLLPLCANTGKLLLHSNTPSVTGYVLAKAVLCRRHLDTAAVSHGNSPVFSHLPRLCELTNTDATQAYTQRAAACRFILALQPGLGQERSMHGISSHAQEIFSPFRKGGSMYCLVTTAAIAGR
jgi:hypothetical protein